MPKKATKTTKRATKKKAAPTRTTKRVAKSAARLRVRQVRSGIGHSVTFRRTLRALGLRHYQHEVVVSDNPSTRGMLHKVRHLVRVRPEEA